MQIRNQTFSLTSAYARGLQPYRYFNSWLTVFACLHQNISLTFLPVRRYASAVLASLYLSVVSKKSGFLSKLPDKSSWFWHDLRPILHGVLRKFGSPKIRALSSETLSQTIRTCYTYDGRRVVIGRTLFTKRCD